MDTSFYNGFDTSGLYNPTPYTSVPASVTTSVPTSVPSVAAEATPELVGGSNPTTFNVFKVIIIIILLILIAVAIALAIVFRNQALEAENNENPACPTIACPVGAPNFPTCATDADCGSSAFATINGKKICSSTRYS
jgi:hypothetical protein